MLGKFRAGRGGQRATVVPVACRGYRLGTWRGEARTSNMPRMFVTREVFQLEMSALKLYKFLKRSLMSVTPETHQSAMGPYVAMAAARSALCAWTAVRREALVVKVFWVVQATRGGLGGGGGDEGDGDGQLPGPQLEP